MEYIPLENKDQYEQFKKIKNKNWENEFGLNTQEEFVNYFTKIFKKHGPKELQNYALRINFRKEKGDWANIYVADFFQDPKKNGVYLSINSNLLHPKIPVIFKKETLLHELSHLFSSTFIGKSGYAKTPEEKRFSALTKQHSKGFSDKFNFLVKTELNSDIIHPELRTKKDYILYTQHYDPTNLWHKKNTLNDIFDENEIHEYLDFVLERKKEVFTLINNKAMGKESHYEEVSQNYIKNEIREQLNYLDYYINNLKLKTTVGKFNKERFEKKIEIFNNLKTAFKKIPFKHLRTIREIYNN